MIDDAIRCLVRGCDFVVDNEDGWRETMEDHVRWIHVARRDFGAYPIPSVITLTINGLLRQDEAQKFLDEIVVASTPVPRKIEIDLSPFATWGLLGILGAVALNTLLALREYGIVDLGAHTSAILRIALSGILVVVAFTFFQSLHRIVIGLRAIRQSSYTDTTMEDAD